MQKWNTHSRYLDLADDRRRAFSIVPVGNQITDSRAIRGGRGVHGVSARGGVTALWDQRLAAYRRGTQTNRACTARWGGEVDRWAKFDAEREALCDDLAGLEASQWDTQSLCTEWKVRHVVSHLVAEGHMTVGTALIGVMKNGMNPNRYVARVALAAGQASPESFLSQLRATVGARTTPLHAKPVVMLEDTVCHSADIRRPLGINRKFPEDTLVEVAENLKGAGFPLGTRKRSAGLNRPGVSGGSIS